MAYTTINKSSDYFNTKLYTGNGSASRSITGVGFQPDWLWVKARSYTYYHGLWDAVRTNKYALYSNATNAEDTSTGGTLGSLDSDGFTTPNVSDGGFININSVTYASWNWLANGAGSANTDGSINSTVSANTTSGFSIVSWTGTGSLATVGHGIDTPKMIIVKNRSTTNGWEVYHQSIGNTKYLALNVTDAELASASRWNNTSPTSTVFTVNTEGGVNSSGGNLIAYCFAEKQGYSKFGSYVGTNSDDGTFLYLGFKPAFIMVKAVSGSNTPASQNWVILDNKRSSSGGNNVIQYKLFPSATDAENTAENNHADFLSNGVKFRGANDATNGTNTYIYMAFAEAPLVGSNNVPCTAR